MQTRIAYCIYRDAADNMICSQVFWEYDPMKPINWQELLKDTPNQADIEILTSGYYSVSESEKRAFAIMNAITMLHSDPEESCAIMSDFLSTILSQPLAALIDKFDLK